MFQGGELASKADWFSSILNVCANKFINKEVIMSFEESSKQSYTSQFLTLKSAGDILNAVNPIGKSAEKEISESMGIIKHLRNIVLREPMKYKLFDLCAGNSLTSIIACHLLPIKSATAIDIRERNRHWSEVKRFNYLFRDIYKIEPEMFDEDSIIIGVHACKDLAKRIVELYNKSKAKHLLLMPCCESSLSGKYQLVCDKIGKSLMWCLELAIECNGKMHKDQKILSPKNVVIVAQK
jgi:hypothetical protein